MTETINFHELEIKQKYILTAGNEIIEALKMIVAGCASVEPKIFQCCVNVIPVFVCLNVVALACIILFTCF